MRGGTSRLFPPTAPPTVRSQSVFNGSGRSSWEYGSSGSVPDSSVGNQGSPDRNVGPICVDLVLVPVCDVCVPFTALAVGSVEAARSPHLPVDPASDTVVTLALWRTGAVVLGVGVTGPSLPVCPLVTTIMSLLSNSGFTSYFLILIKRHKVRTTGPTQVVPVPRLITYFWYYLLDQNSVRVRTRNNTGRVESLFDLSPSLISLSLFCVQGMRVLAQVALAYLVFGTFCFPGITSSTVPPGIVSKYPNPGRAPIGTLSCGVQVVGGGGASSRGFLARLVGTRAPLAFFIFRHTLSEGRGVVFRAPRVRLLRES